MSELLERYKKACDYPGELDEPAVEAAFGDYLKALKTDRKIVHLSPHFNLEDHADLKALVVEVASKIPARAARDARDASGCGRPQRNGATKPSTGSGLGTRRKERYAVRP